MSTISKRRAQEAALMVLDIDHLKRVNDIYGQDVGDLVLKGFGAELVETVRGADLVVLQGAQRRVRGLDGRVD
jgi:diguanylate cyclase (GGDEF)-like protein